VVVRGKQLAAGTHQPSRRRAAVERIGPDDLGGLVGPARARDASPATRAPVLKAAGGRTPAPRKSYVGIWRRRVASYEAFVGRCRAMTSTAGAPRCQPCAAAAAQRRRLCS